MPVIDIAPEVIKTGASVAPPLLIPIPTPELWAELRELLLPSRGVPTVRELISTLPEPVFTSPPSQARP